MAQISKYAQERLEAAQKEILTFLEHLQSKKSFKKTALMFAERQFSASEWWNFKSYSSFRISYHLRFLASEATIVVLYLHPDNDDFPDHDAFAIAHSVRPLKYGRAKKQAEQFFPLIRRRIFAHARSKKREILRPVTKKIKQIVAHYKKKLRQRGIFFDHYVDEFPYFDKKEGVVWMVQFRQKVPGIVGALIPLALIFDGNTYRIISPPHNATIKHKNEAYAHLEHCLEELR